MYGINKDLEVKESVYFNAGIHSNVAIEKICIENSKQDGSGKTVLAFHFKGANGETFRHVEWPINSEDAAAETKMLSMSKRIKSILNKFVPEDKIVVANVSTFEEYAQAIINIAGDSFKEKTFAIKLVYDDKGYLGFTKYLGFIANDAAHLSIGKNEKIAKPTPSSAGDLEQTATQTEDLF